MKKSENAQDEHKVFRDAYGQLLGTAETVGGITIYRDKYGRQVASAAFDARESELAKTLDENARYFNPAVTADIIVIRSHAKGGHDGNPPGVRRQELLLIQRRENPDKGMWAFPGGHMDATDENIEAAAVRELKEETGLVAKELRPVGVLSQQSEMDKPCICHVFVYPFWANDGAGDDARASDDAKNATWFAIKVTDMNERKEQRIALTAKSGSFKGKQIVFAVRQSFNPLGFVENKVTWDDDETTAGRLAFDHANMLARALLLCPEYANLSVAE